MGVLPAIASEAIAGSTTLTEFSIGSFRSTLRSRLIIELRLLKNTSENTRWASAHHFAMMPSTDWKPAMTSLTISLDSVVELTDEQFYALCQANRDLRFERSPTGELTIMSPAGSETGNRNAGIIAQLWFWNELSNLGLVFDSSTGFKLPNGADRSPDAAWIKLERWTALTPDQQQRFAPICPDFVVELMSPSDNLIAVRVKLQEYLDNGIRLGWLINRDTQTVEIYRPGQPVELLNKPTTLSGEDVLPGFNLKLEKIW